MPHISFSELKNWQKCPYYHKLVHIDKLKGFEGNAYTAFGSAVHDVCERMLLDGHNNGSEQLFEAKFLQELQSLSEEVKTNFDKKLVSDMRRQGKEIVTIVLDAAEEYFGAYEVVSTEERLMQPIAIEEYSDYGYSFKGFIDLVVKTNDGKYHIIDWKTCTWGWASRKKTEPMTTYQLTFYKHYFAIKHGIKPENIETHFALLKRSATTNRVEFFRVTSGNKKTNNAINLLAKALYNITHKNFVKNRLSCEYPFRCEFYKTKHCR